MFICHHNVDLALTLAMSSFIKNPCTRMIILGKQRHRNVHLSSKCRFGVGVGNVERFKESLYENKNSALIFDHKLHLFIKNVDLSLEILVFGATQGVLAYVLKRERGVPAKEVDL